MAQIAHIANLWSLVGHPPARTEWSLAKKIAAVAAAGFDGFTTRLGPEHRRLAEKHSLVVLGFVSSSDPSEFESAVRAQKEGGAVHLNVQLDDHDTPPAVAAKHWLQLTRIAEKLGGLVLSLEVHRDTCTETPEKTYEIADRYYKATGQLIKLNFDFSHFSVVKHLDPDNYAERLLTRADLFQNSEQYHMRPFNGHHCQVPVTYRGKLTPEIMSYLGFAQTSMKLWKSAAANRDKTWYVCPEMGPYGAKGGGYNITGLPPAWPDAVVLRGELAKLWRKA